MPLEFQPLTITVKQHAEDRTYLEQVQHSIRRAVHGRIIAERDRLQTEVEHLTDALDRVRSAHQYSLGVRCTDCPAMLTVSTNREPAAGALASTLLHLGLISKWRFAPHTSSELSALMGVEWKAVHAGVKTPGMTDADRCPNCEEKERERGYPATRRVVPT